MLFSGGYYAGEVFFSHRGRGFIVLGRLSRGIEHHHAVRCRWVRPGAGGLDRWTGDWTGMLHAVAAFAVLWLGLWYLYRNRTFVKI
jgi:hypothetical protein